MNSRNFLEQVAKEVHYSPRIKELTSEQPMKVQEAVYSSNSSLIHDQFVNVGYLANPTDVVAL